MVSLSFLIPVLVVSLFVASPFADAYGDEFTLKDIQTLEKIFQNYDKRIKPTDNNGHPSNISVRMYFAGINGIESSNMQYSTDAYLTQKWVDSRFSNQGIADTIKFNDPSYVRKIWKPDIFFPTATDAEFQYVTVPNVKILISPNGEITYMLRMKIRSTCLIDLSKYPFDTKICQLQMAPFSTDSVLQWENIDAPISVSSEMRFPEFELVNITTGHCKERSYIGSDSCLLAEFHLKRVFVSHLTQIFLPSILMVIIAWITFWMDVDDINARGIITMLCFLGLINLGHSSSSAEASYIKAIDVWIGACAILISVSFLEMSIVNYLWRIQGVSAKGKGKTTAEKLEKWSRILFPITFLSFIIVFCCFYLA